MVQCREKAIEANMASMEDKVAAYRVSSLQARAVHWLQISCNWVMQLGAAGLLA